MGDERVVEDGADDIDESTATHRLRTRRWLSVIAPSLCKVSLGRLRRDMSALPAIAPDLTCILYFVVVIGVAAAADAFLTIFSPYN